MILTKCVADFFRGDLENNCKVYLSNWKSVCLLKYNGRLGLRHTRTMNIAFVMKIRRGLVKNKDAIWSRVLRSKYKCGNDIILAVQQKNTNLNL